MKKTIYFFAIIMFGLSSCGSTNVIVQTPRPRPVPPPPPVVVEEQSYQTFYDELSPYGQWIDYPGHGYVWMPNVGLDFKPYSTNGHWVYSEAGWVWASEYNWGWAAFHYGRWFYDTAYGWLWVPGHEWAPAWVSWRKSNDYYGWAPLNPGITVGISISTYTPPNNYWSFVPHQYITSPRVNNYYVSETKNVTIINNTTVINNNVTNNNTNNTTNNNITNNTTNNITNNHTNYTSVNNINNTTVNNNVKNNVYAAGPDPNEVSQATGTTLHPVAITNSSKPGQQVGDNQLALYRPKINPATNVVNKTNGGVPQHIAPAKVQTLSNVKPIINNNATTASTVNSTVPVNNNLPAAKPNNNVIPANNAVTNSTAKTNTQQGINPPINKQAVVKPQVKPVVNNYNNNIRQQQPPNQNVAGKVNQPNSTTNTKVKPQIKKINKKTIINKDTKTVQ